MTTPRPIEDLITALRQRISPEKNPAHVIDIMRRAAEALRRLSPPGSESGDAMTKYRKKPVVIDAWPVREIIDIFSDEVATPPEPIMQAVMRKEIIVGCDGVIVKTLEGEMSGGLNDWLLRGVTGEFYPCKPDVFAKTYEAAE